MAHVTSDSKSLSVPFSVWNAGITGVSGSLTKGSTLTISGYDFGEGPAFENCFYDGCDGTGTRTVNDPAVGVYSLAQASQTYESGGRDGGNCVRHLRYDTGANDIEKGQCWIDFSPSKKVYFSYWYKHMPNTFWPDGVNPSDGGLQVTGRDTFNGAGSSAKLAWIGYESPPDFAHSTTNDIVLPTYASSGGFVLGGNDIQNIIQGSGFNEFWEFGEWIRITGYFEMHPTDGYNNDNKVFVEFMRPSATGQKTWEFNETFRLSNPANNPPEAWNRVTFASFFRGGDFSSIDANITDDDIDHRLDDIYLASGDNAPARVEIGDNSDYDLCTEKTLCQPASNDWWSDGQVKVIVEQGGLNLAGDVWLFVTHSDNKRRMSFKVN